MRSIKLYGTGSATANNVANVTIPTAGRLKGIQYSIRIDAPSDNANMSLEVSQASATEYAVNGAQQCVAVFGAFGNLVTSGLAFGSIVGFVPVDVPLKQGQLLYLHAGLISGVTAYYAELILWIQD